MENPAPARPAGPEPAGPAQQPGRTRPAWVRTLVITLVVAVAAIGFVIVPQPNIALTNLQPGAAGCYPTIGAYWIYGFRFNLVNTGLTGGIATVTGSLDGVAVGSQQYSVARGASVEGGMTFSASDCGTHAASVAITSVEKAWW